MIDDKEKPGVTMYGPPMAFHGYNHTIKIDPDYCTGCYRCQEDCQGRDVIARCVVDGKKKAYVKHPDHCRGCLKCLRNCLTNAIVVVTLEKPSATDTLS
jgi:NAD-dependent dihydropyrimidine dehydrogenase PreA subunit